MAWYSAFSAYFLWGLFPLYFRLLRPAGAVEILAHRMLWSFVFVLLALAVLRRWSWFRELARRPKVFALLAVAAVLISVNWGVYIYGVNTDRVVETSLGYFINPLVSVLLGVVVLRERLRPGQWVAVGIGATAVLVLTVDYGRPPWIAFVLAGSFGTYGLLKKTAGAPAAEGLAVESGVLAPLALGYLCWLESSGDAALGHVSAGHTASADQRRRDHRGAAAALRRRRQPGAADHDGRDAVPDAHDAVRDRRARAARVDAAGPAGRLRAGLARAGGLHVRRAAQPSPPARAVRRSHLLARSCQHFGRHLRCYDTEDVAQNGNSGSGTLWLARNSVTLERMTLWTLLDHSASTALDLQFDAAGTLRAPLGSTPLGWERKPHGWCREHACVPALAAAPLETEDGLDLLGFAALTGLAVAVDRDERVIATGPGAAALTAGLATGEAPDFTLATVEGTPWSLREARGQKVALVFWASWCGCRWDLPEWEKHHRALAGNDFTVVSVALDRRPADAAPWIAEADVTHPALVDAGGAVAALYHVVNVPTVVWIDERGRIARPQDSQTASDRFRDWNGINSAHALATLYRWVREDDAGLSADEVRQHLRLPTEDDQRARVETDLAVWLLSVGRTEAAERHFALAAEFAPQNVALRRGSMPLRGIDSFGPEYFKLAQEFAEAGAALQRPLPDWHHEAR